MGLRSSALIIAGLVWAGTLQATALPVPSGLAADVTPGSLSLSWEAVNGAGLYRVAVFDAPEKDGKRPLLAAVWVKGNEYVYAQTATVAKAGKFPSTKPLPLPAAHKLRVMVAAAKADGSDKGEWAGLDVESASVAKPASTPSPTPTLTFTPGALSSTAKPDAELEVQGGEEFKQTPDAAVLEIDESAEVEAAAAGAAGAAAATTGLATTAPGASKVADAVANSATVQSSVSAASTIGEAKGLNVSGHFEQAETAYRTLLEKDPENADHWEGLGDSFAGRKMKLEAKEAYEKALSLNKAKTHLKDWIDKNVRR